MQLADKIKEELGRLSYPFGWTEMLWQRRRSARMRRRYPQGEEMPPVVILLYNDISAPGGLCDRLRSMCGTYKVCCELGLQYKIGHFIPFALSDFLQPDSVDWRISESDIIKDLKQIEVIDYTPVAMHHTPRRKFDAYCDFNHNALKKWFAGVRGKKQIHVYHGLYSVRYEEIKPLFRTLFVPTPELNACIEENKRRLGERYVSATLRFQNLMGDFYEGARYKELKSEEEKNDYIRRSLAAVEDIHRRHPESKVLVTADSLRFLKEAQRFDFVHVIPGTITHLSNTSVAEHAVYLKSFVDLLTIADADKVYLLRTGRMYNSRFARTAAAIGGRPYELVEY